MRPVDPVEQITRDESYDMVFDIEEVDAYNDVKTAQNSGSLITSNANLNPPEPVFEAEVVTDAAYDPSVKWWKSGDPGGYPLDVLVGQGCPSDRWIRRHAPEAESMALLLDMCRGAEVGAATGESSPFWPPCAPTDEGCLRAKMIQGGVHPDEANSIPLGQMQQMEDALIKGQAVYFSQVGHGGQTAPVIPGHGGVLDSTVIVQEQQPEPTEYEFAPAPITATPVGMDFRIIAGLLGAAALGGTLWYMTQRAPRRRAA